MATKHKNTNRKLTKMDKRIRVDEAKERIRISGGTFIKANWNKNNVHFLTATGNKGYTRL